VQLEAHRFLYAGPAGGVRFVRMQVAGRVPPSNAGPVQSGAEVLALEISDDELIGLVQSLPCGNVRRDRACEALIARHGHIVRLAVHHYRPAPDIAEDLAQVGYLGLKKAITNFDHRVRARLPSQGGSERHG
jgi:Sigma-70 region 2